MPATVRLMRVGKKGYASYRIVVTDKRKKQNGMYREIVGTYDPNPKTPKLRLDQDMLNGWIQKGALISEGLRKLLKNKKLINPPPQPK